MKPLHAAAMIAATLLSLPARAIEAEVALGPRLQLRTKPLLEIAPGGVAGSVGVFSFDDYSKRAPADGMDWAAVLLAAPTMGMIFVPGDVWLGNDRGGRLDGAVDLDGDWHVALGYAGRVARDDTNWTFPSVLSALLPAVGVGQHDGHTAVRLDYFRLPAGYRFSERLAMELRPSFFAEWPVCDGCIADFGVTTSLVTILRPQ